MLTCPDFRAFSSILMRLADPSSPVGVPEVLGPAPTLAGLPMEAEEGDRELVGVLLLFCKKLLKKIWSKIENLGYTYSVNWAVPGVRDVARLRPNV